LNIFSAQYRNTNKPSMPFFGSDEMGVIRVELCVNNVAEMLKHYLRKKTLPETIDYLDFTESGHFWKFVAELENGYNDMREESGPFMMVSHNDFKTWFRKNYTKMKTWVAVEIEIAYLESLVEHHKIARPAWLPDVETNPASV
tara:strand:- start:5872 stop:6300 length:429 start_codon:yes stop_codon:yes gene_type:complete